MQRNRNRHSRWYILTGIALIIAFVVVQLILLDETSEEQSVIESQETAGLEEQSSLSSTNSERFIDQYLNFVSDNTPNEQSMPMHDYISNAVVHLAQALQQLSDEEVIQLNPSTIKQLQDQSEEIVNTAEANKTMVVKHTFSMISGTMRSLEISNTEQLHTEMGNLEQMVNAIQQEVDITEQDVAVSQFLAQAGLVLELIEEEA